MGNKQNSYDIDKMLYFVEKHNEKANKFMNLVIPAEISKKKKNKVKVNSVKKKNIIKKINTVSNDEENNDVEIKLK
jgi:hypothetical protein